MPLPSTGWLAEASNTVQSPELALLPEVEEITYEDGADGTIDTDVDGVLVIVEHSIGGYEITHDIGLIGSDVGFYITVQRTSTYSAFLLESILVPSFDSFETETPTPVEVAKDPCYNYVDLENFEACCVADLGWYYNGKYTANGSKKAGNP